MVVVAGKALDLLEPRRREAAPRGIEAAAVVAAADRPSRIAALAHEEVTAVGAGVRKATVGGRDQRLVEAALEEGPGGGAARDRAVGEEMKGPRKELAPLPLPLLGVAVIGAGQDAGAPDVGIDRGIHGAILSTIGRAYAEPVARARDVLGGAPPRRR